MAKRPSARRASDEDDVEDDSDAYAWESPKGKKDSGKGPAKSKSATGRTKGKRPSAEEEEEPAEDEAPKKKGKSTGKMAKSGSARLEGSSRTKKSGSTRRASSNDEDDEDEGGGSGRRRRAAPAKKKSDNTVILISIATLTLILIVGLVMRGQMMKPGLQRNDQTDLERIMTLGKEGEKAFREWNKAKGGGGGNEQVLYGEAKTKLQSAVEQLTGMLGKPPYADSEGNTKPEYEGYERPLQDWATLLVDLEKGSTLGGG